MLVVVRRDEGLALMVEMFNFCSHTKILEQALDFCLQILSFGCFCLALWSMVLILRLLMLRIHHHPLSVSVMTVSSDQDMLRTFSCQAPTHLSHSKSTQLNLIHLRDE